MIKASVLFLSLLLPVTSFAYPIKPNIKISPGHLCTIQDKDFERLRYDEQIPYCARNVTTTRKDKICALYGVSREDRIKNYTVDHVIPLSLGGSNSDKNLWCQHRNIYSGNYEYQLYRQLETGELRQVQVVHDIFIYKFSPE